MALKAYMGFSSDAGSEEGACLVFAHSSKEARKLAHPFISDWFGLGWIDTRVRLIKDSKHLFDTEANKEKIANDVSHVIDSPTVCKDCEQWGSELDESGLCEDCQEAMLCDSEEVIA